MRIFFAESQNDYNIDLIEGLCRAGCAVTHASAHAAEKDAALLKQRPGCGDIKFIDGIALHRRKKLKEKYGHYFVPVDADILAAFADIERDFYILTDRANHVPVSFRERKLFFRDLIRFWLGYLKEEEIEGVYYPCGPHTGSELVLMQACRYLGLPFVYLAHTAINNRSLLRSGYNEIPAVPEGYLKGLSADEVRAQTDTGLIRDYEEESIVTQAIKAENDAFHKQKVNTDPALAAQIQQARTQVSPALYVKRALGQLLNIFQRHRDHFYLPLAMDGRSSPAAWSSALRRHKKAAAELKAFYEQHAKPLDPTQPYVYFPMHLQPELTTQPEAGIFEDHYLVLEHILAALPEGWKVYVKENPRQFDTTINAVSAMNFRDRQDLQDMLEASPLVHFVPQSVRTPDLIANAQAVVTQTGTAGWECLTSGKACITFGRPWYSGCRSCFKVSTVEELRAAFAKVPLLTAEQVRGDVMRLLHYYQDRFFIGTLSDPTNIAYNSRPYKDLLAGHIQALADFFKTATASSGRVKRAAGE